MNLVSAEYQRHGGLGNKLFPWSRAKVFAREIGCKMLAPCWFSPRGGALTRGGIDYRHAVSKIWLVRNFRSDPNATSPLGAYLKYGRLPKCFVTDLPNARENLKDGRHYVFKTSSCHCFRDLRSDRKFILDQLVAIARPSQLNLVSRFNDVEFIALNIRMGNDFVSKASGRPGHHRTELTWFANALSVARERYGNLAAFVISDGGPRQLNQILELPNVELAQTPTAIGDLLILAKARVLLGSGNSSFSAWASFLGGMDTFSSADTPFDHFEIAEGNSAQQIVATL